MDDELSVLFDTRHLNILRSLNKRVETRQMFHADSSNSRETVLSDVLIDIEVVDVLNTLFEHLVSLKGELDIDVDVRGHPSDFEDCEHVYLLSDDMNTDQASNATTPYQRRQKRIHEVCGNVDEYGTMSTTYAMANNTSILLKKVFLSLPLSHPKSVITREMLRVEIFNNSDSSSRYMTKGRNTTFPCNCSMIWLYCGGH